MTELRLALLGPPVVLRDGLPVTFDTRKAVALLALLAMTGREHSREQLARGLQRLVAACIAAGDLERATGHARRWLQLDPLHEPAHQAIIRLHGWAGQRSAAMRQYRSLVRVLDRDLAVRPLPETTRVYDDVRAGRLEPPPAPLAGRVAEGPGAAADGAMAAPGVGRGARVGARGAPRAGTGRRGAGLDA